MWNCSKCKEKVDDEFEICWSCGTTRDGVEDPDFAREDEGIISADDFERDRLEKSNENLVTVATFLKVPDAHACKLELEARGVRAMIVDEHAVNLNFFLANAMGGAKVQVLERDVERARQILEGPAEDPDTRIKRPKSP